MRSSTDSFASLPFLALLIGIVLAGLSCKEPLPAYKNPNEVFEGFLHPVYLYSSTENSLAVYLTVINTYDETFEGRALFDGSIEIAYTRNPSIKKTFYLSEANLIQVRKYNPNSNVLTFDPGDSIRLGVKWFFIDDDNNDLRAGVFNYHEDINCTARHIAAAESFIIRGNVKVYEKTEIVEPNAVITSLCHVNTWVSPKVCPSLPPEYACESRKP